MQGRFAILLTAAVFICCSTAPDEDHVAGGTFVGYTYSEQAVVDVFLEMEPAYTLTFKAYDLGGNARFIVYAQRKGTGDYYPGVIRLSIEDPDGNMFTHYHDTVGEAIDRPILWTRRVPGIHNASVEFAMGGGKYARATFEVPLIREPVSGLIVTGISLGVLVLAAMAVVLIRKRR